MKHLKLFESFSDKNKITVVNNLVISFLCFNYFYNNDVRVKENAVDFELIAKSRFKIAGFFPLFHWVLVYDGFKFSKKVFKGFIHYKNETHLNVPIADAINKWIEYLENTPEKKHLLQK